MKQNTEKITVSLPKETLRIADENRGRFGYHTRSDFIDAAIREYVSRDLLKEFTGELAQFYKKIGHSEIKEMEEHLAKLSYKIAVEMAQVNLLLASVLDLGDGDISKLRKKALDLVNSNRGYIPLRTANKSQIDIKIDMDMEDMSRRETYQTAVGDTLYTVTCESPNGVDDAVMNRILRTIERISIDS
jgi:metal-responsive CopG/Arc/MetJ family transcriptional regulator